MTGLRHAQCFPNKEWLVFETGGSVTTSSRRLEMRAEDHQLLPYYADTFSKDVEKTGLAWKTDFFVPAADLTLPTTCQMTRAAS